MPDGEYREIRVHLKNKDVFIGYAGDDYLMSETNIVAPPCVQRQIANALISDKGKSGSVCLGRVMVDDEEVGYRHPVVQALAASVLQKTNGQLGLKNSEAKSTVSI